MTPEETGTQPKPTVNIRELSEHLCRLVVRTPEKVQITESGSDRTKIVTAQVADDDIGRVIGKQGSTIRSIRYLLDQVGRKNKLKVYFEIKNKQQQQGPEVKGTENTPGVSSPSRDERQ